MKFTGEKKQVGHLDNLDTLPFHPVNIRLKKCPGKVSRFFFGQNLDTFKANCPGF